SLLAEVSKKVSEADKEWNSLDKELSKDRETFFKLTAAYTAVLERHEGRRRGEGLASKGSVEVAAVAVPVGDDPWVAKNNVNRHIQALVAKQKNLRAALLRQQQSFSIFETTIIQHLRNTLSLFFEWSGRDISSHTQTLYSLQSTLESIPLESDWALFKKKHAQRLVESRVPALIEPADIPYEGADDSAAEIVHEATLLRREGLMSKGWKAKHVVMTTSGWLHVFSARVDFERDGVEPEIALYLPHCTLGTFNDGASKEPGEIVLVERSFGVMSGE
ncbi:hypothetical protein BDK51DRAFT_28977, partial [Blyttiomyces helicus]